MKYIPVIPKKVTPQQRQNQDYSPLKDESYVGEKNFINYSFVLPISVLESDDAKHSSIINTTEQDYANGYFIRYFLKKRNEDKIIEVNSDIYNGEGDKYDPTLYLKFELNWKLTGKLHDIYINGIISEYGIIDTNKRTVQNTNTKFNIVLDLIIRNYSEYAKI